jgi:hypothetical protein
MKIQQVSKVDRSDTVTSFSWPILVKSKNFPKERLHFRLASSAKLCGAQNIP